MYETRGKRGGGLVITLALGLLLLAFAYLASLGPAWGLGDRGYMSDEAYTT